MGYIYKITNKINGQSYIGLTKCHDYKNRWRGHLNNNDNYYFNNVLKKLGKDAFTWEILIICFDEDVSRYEKEYIKRYNTIRPNGYNLTEGGELGWNHHPDTVAKLKESKAGKGNHRPPGFKYSDESKLKMSESTKAWNDARSPEERRLSAKKATETKSTRTYPKRGIPVIQLKDGVEIARFTSSCEAGRQTGILYKSIHAVCKGRKWVKTAGGFEWKFAS
jgi:group I intron endonuclease